jgi:hypothetical protein
MAEDQYDVVAFSQGHECYETFEVYLDEVTDKIRKLLGDYSVPGWSEPEGRWYRKQRELSEYGATDRMGAARQAAWDLKAFLDALVVAAPWLGDSVAEASLQEVSA